MMNTIRRLPFLVQVVSILIYSLMGLEDWLYLALKIICILRILNQSPNL